MKLAMFAMISSSVLRFIWLMGRQKGIVENIVSNSLKVLFLIGL